MSEDPFNWQQAARYLAGEGTPGERQRLEAWSRADASHRALMYRLARIWEAAEKRPGRPPGRERDVEAEWEALCHELRSRERSRRRERSSLARRRPVRRRRRGWLPASFSRVLVVLVVLAGSVLLMAELSGVFSTTRSSLREIVTGRGERARVRLADGTEVMLNVDSRLRLPATFGQRPVREVYLRGEAYFDVAPNPERPFIIHAGSGLIRVVGTAFNVEAYPEEQEVEVAVAEGIVFFKARQRGEQEEGIRLEAGELGRLAGGSAHTIKIAGEIDVEAYLSWIEGRLVFENAALREVAARLERWYDVECRLEGEGIGSLHFTGVLNSRSIRDVLEVVTTSLGLGYRIEGNTVILKRKQ